VMLAQTQLSRSLTGDIHLDLIPWHVSVHMPMNYCIA
jgi:hypothetical protein